MIGVPACQGPYSSTEFNYDAPHAGCMNLGIRFELLCITDIFQSYRKTLHDVFAGRKEDTTEENLRTITRGNAADGAFQ